jgi:hypothetical protein
MIKREACFDGCLQRFAHKDVVVLPRRLASSMPLRLDVTAWRICARAIVERRARRSVQTEAIDQAKDHKTIRKVAVPAPVGFVGLRAKIQITSEYHALPKRRVEKGVRSENCLWHGFLYECDVWLQPLEETQSRLSLGRLSAPVIHVPRNDPHLHLTPPMPLSELYLCISFSKNSYATIF